MSVIVVFQLSFFFYVKLKTFIGIITVISLRFNLIKSNSAYNYYNGPENKGFFNIFHICEAFAPNASLWCSEQESGDFHKIVATTYMQRSCCPIGHWYAYNFAVST